MDDSYTNIIEDSIILSIEMLIMEAALRFTIEKPYF